MSARQDAARIAALVAAVDDLAAGKNQQLGQLAARVFDWTPERVFLAIDSAIRSGLIARNDDSGAVASGGFYAKCTCGHDAATHRGDDGAGACMLCERDGSSQCAAFQSAADYARRHGGVHGELDVQPEDEDRRSEVIEGFTREQRIALRLLAAKTAPGFGVRLVALGLPLHHARRAVGVLIARGHVTKGAGGRTGIHYAITFDGMAVARGAFGDEALARIVQGEGGKFHLEPGKVAP